MLKRYGTQILSHKDLEQMNGINQAHMRRSNIDMKKSVKLLANITGPNFLRPKNNKVAPQVSDFSESSVTLTTPKSSSQGSSIRFSDGNEQNIS